MEILKVEKLTNERWLNLYACHFQHQAHHGRWVYASRKEPDQPHQRADAVVIVPILHVPAQPPRLVLQKEFRVPIRGFNYGLPAGLLEEGESIEDTVRRELHEETGLELVRIKKISPVLYSSTGMTDESAYLVFVDVALPPQPRAQALEGSEIIEVILLDHAEVCRLCEHPDLPIDAKAWTVLYLYQQLGHLS